MNHAITNENKTGGTSMPPVMKTNLPDGLKTVAASR
jgi:hypothetical protein